MHIPDNYLSPASCAVLTAAVVPVLAVSVKKVKEEVSKIKLPQLGIGAAFSFLLMMFNVPLPGGTTGHAVGGTLIAILLGPYSACISVTVALLIQALLFGDGGILAFGANVFNLAFVLPFVGYYVYKLIKDRLPSRNGDYIGTAVGAYFGLNVAALVTAVQFGLQPLLFKSAEGLPLYCPYPLSVAVPAMTIPHLLVAGVVEAVFSVFIYAFIKKVSPGMIYEGAKKRMKAIYAFIAALICLTPLGLLAAGTAWGEWGADEIKDIVTGGNVLGYTPAGMENGFSFNAIMPDYVVGELPEAVGYIASAVIGVAVMIIIFKIIAALKKDRVQA
jgi:cobalt/nickel transport system permease protein